MVGRALRNRKASFVETTQASKSSKRDITLSSISNHKKIPSRQILIDRTYHSRGRSPLVRVKLIYVQSAALWEVEESGEIQERLCLDVRMAPQRFES
jgi:hypothetical protein